MNTSVKLIMKRLFLSFVLLLLASMPMNVMSGNWCSYYYGDYEGFGTKAPSTFTINEVDLTVTTGDPYSLHIPFSNTHANYYCRSQMIIPATTSYGDGTLADLAGTTWSKVVFYIHSAYTNYAIVSGLSYDIYFSETNDTHYQLDGTSSSYVHAAFKDYSSATKVYSGSISKVNDKVTINFSTDYEYYGGNILVTVVETAKSTSTQANRYAIKKGMTNYQSIFEYSSSSIFSSTAGVEALRGLPYMTVTYDYTSAKTPTFSPVAGTYNASMNVAISTITDGATIHYTTNGSDPTTSSPVYTSPVSINTTTTLKAIAVKEGLDNSTVGTAEYMLRPAKPTFNPVGGVYTSVQNVTIIPPVCEHPVTLHYTTDGSTPTVASPVYTSPITVSSATTLKAIAVTDAEGWFEGEVQSAYYNVIEGGSLTIDDRLPHNLTYYDNDIISSPNPIDATIIYDGNGGMLGLDAPVAALTYHKTIEKDFDGNYYYTLIPSFSSRPAGKVFEGWKLTSVLNGTVGGYAVGDVIPAETIVTLTGSDGMSLSLQAQWGAVANVYYAGTITELKAALSKSTAATYGLDPNGTVESNYIIANRADFTSGFNVSDQIAVTITCVDPRDLTDVRETIEGYQHFGCSPIECHNDTRFEYITMGGIENIRGNGHNLTFGRGIEKPVALDYCANMISTVDTAIATTSTSTKVLNCKLRVESGVYNYSYGLVSESGENGYLVTVNSNGNRVRVEYGSDYDRAMNDNDKLVVKERACLVRAYKFSGSNNVFRINVKSGTFSTNSTETFYLGFSNAQESNGQRKANIEGGVFEQGIAGGIDGGNAVGSEALMLRMTGGIVNGPIYGAGEYSSASGVRRIVITGGTIAGWVAGGCNGTKTDGGLLTGNTYLYIGGNTEVNSNGSDVVYGSSVGGNVFGAGSGIQGGTTVGQVNNSNIVIADNAFIERDVYGGGNYGFVASGGTARIRVFGGTINGSVFGGSNQQKGQTVDINMNGGHVLTNVYGGSNTSGTVNNNITIDLGRVTIDGDVFGAGCGASTSVLGTINVTITNATIGGSVFGGGEMGASMATVVTMSGGTVNGNIFGGALGQDAVLVQGNKTVNFINGFVKGSIYGGSRNANDANLSFVNMSGGTVGRNVYGGGFFGSINGSTYVNIGRNAVLNSPCASLNTDKQVISSPLNLNINESVFAGSDWGEFTAGSTFMAPNITGVSHIYIDALGYDDKNFFINNSVYGSGTSGDAGAQGHDIIIRNYGGWNTGVTSRSLYTIQRAGNVILDNANISFIGKGDLSSPQTTKLYSILNIDNALMLTNNSTIALNSPVEMIKSLGSYSCTDAYALDTVVVNYADLNNCDNKIYFKNGSFVNVNYDNNGVSTYGRLAGYFHALAENGYSGFAFARPKINNNSGDAAFAGWSAYAPLNVNDGGFVSYNAAENTFNAIGGTSGSGVQMPYEHHPHNRDDHVYYRVWNVGSGLTQNDVVIVASADGENDEIRTASAIMELPRTSSNNGCSYYRITNIEWSDAAQFVNAGMYNANNYAHLYYNEDDMLMNYQHTAADCVEDIGLIHENPNYTFGLAMLPAEAITFKNENNNTLPAVLVSEDAEEFYTMQGNTLRLYPDAGDQQKAKVSFVLTYSNDITSTQAFSPVILTLEEVDCTTGEVLMTMNQRVSIQTSTKIQDVEAVVYAKMYGNGAQHARSTVKVVLPTWTLTTGEEYSELTVQDITNIAVVPGATRRAQNYFGTNSGSTTDFGMTFKASKVSDNTLGWLSSAYLNYIYDNETATMPTLVGRADGRDQVAIDFTVHYNGHAHHNEAEDELAQQVYHVSMTNYEGITKEFNITIHIRRRGQAQNWYISSTGSNSYNGQYPDKPKRSVKALQNANPPYVAGDNIFVVGEVKVNTNSEWNGALYDNNINIYRYPGNHKLSDGTFDGNNPYLGNMFRVNSQLIADYVTVDGIYGNADSEINPGGNALITAESSMFYITENGNLVLHNSTLRNNHVVSSAEAVAGGVIMMGNMTVNGTVVVEDNTLNDQNSNVMIASADQKIAIDTVLAVGSHIGVTKTLFPEGSTYSPVAYSVQQNEEVAQNAYSQGYVFSDNAAISLYYNPVETEETNPYTVYIGGGSVDEYVTVCDSYTWHGTDYTVSGVYTYTDPQTQLTTYLHLTINYSDTEETSETYCDSYEWHGTTYTESGDYTYEGATEQGCTLTEILHLTINESETNNYTVSVCQPYEWHGTTYATSGTYYYSGQTAQGCELNETLNLTVGEVITNDVYETVCDAFTWTDGETYTESGTYQQTFTTSTCDSTVILHLTINHSEENTLTVEACDSYIWNGVEYTESGDITATFANAANCDSVVTLHLTINESPVVVITGDTTIVLGDPTTLVASGAETYEWSTGDTTESITVTPTEETTYTVIGTDANGCTATATVTVMPTEGVGESSGDVKVYPNPVSDRLTIEADNISRIAIVDVVGQVVYQVEASGNVVTLNISHLAAGSYFVNITTDNGQMVRKMVKNRQ